MNKKMGRPKVSKNKAKTELRGALFSKLEAKAVDKAAADSGVGKSEWLRDAALEKVLFNTPITTREFIENLCANLKSDEWPEDFEATVTLDGQTVSTGKFSLDSKRVGQAKFQPTDKSNLDSCPLRGAVVKVLGRTEQLLVTNLMRVPNFVDPRYFVWFEVIDEKR